VPWNDALDIVPAKSFTFSLSGKPVPGAAADNLCVRAYDILKKIYNLKPVAIHLHKIIPTGAGLGGGSADGAYTLRTLNRIFNLELSGEKLKEYAALLGSDCAFFIEDRPAIGTGRGEMLSDVALSLKGRYLVIVKPEVHISTGQAFAGITPQKPKTDLRQVLERYTIGDWKGLLENDFEVALFKQFPLIEAIHQKLYAFGALYASMTGSGSAVFGIFKNEVDLRIEFDGLVYWSGVLD
jgi:4-diphosphocytidyl-2-C-methyl-D-erythritol kinase